jgi:hypothetical protein
VHPTYQLRNLEGLLILINSPRFSETQVLQIKTNMETFSVGLSRVINRMTFSKNANGNELLPNQMHVSVLLESICSSHFKKDLMTTTVLIF